MYGCWAVFFFPVKIKSARETTFWQFFSFFSRVESHFHARNLRFFHGRSKLFTGTFLDFFTDGFFCFHGRKNENFHGWVFFFHGQKFRAQSSSTRIGGQSLRSLKNKHCVIIIVGGFFVLIYRRRTIISF